MSPLILDSYVQRLLKEITFGIFGGCKFQEKSQLTFTDLPSLEKMPFNDCTFQEKSQLTFTDLPALKEMTFNSCTFQENSQFTFTKLTSVRQNDLWWWLTRLYISRKFTNSLLQTLPVLKEMIFDGCTFQENSQFTFYKLTSVRQNDLWWWLTRLYISRKFTTHFYKLTSVKRNDLRWL